MFTLNQEFSEINQSKEKKITKKLQPYLEDLKEIKDQDNYEQSQCSLHLPLDKNIVQDVKKIVSQFDLDKLKYVVVVGIGGSNLGAQAVYEGFRGKYNLLDHDYPKMLFLDTVSEKKFNTVLEVLENVSSVEEFAVVVISKSGETTETLVNIETLTAALKEKFAETFKERLVVVTDEGSSMWQTAEEKEVKKISVPKNVGGRFSVFSAVGLLPLALIGVDIDKLMSGAQKAIEDNLNPESSLSAQSAVITYYHNKKNRHILNTFIFNTELESLGLWHRQLIGESLGKDGKGITPLISIGTTDLHSVAQLYFGGQDDKYTNIIYAKSKSDLALPQQLNNDSFSKILAGKKFTDVMDAVVGGVIKAYQNNGLPFSYLELPEINEENLGYYMQFRMIEVMLLAQLLGVNAFDQPRVEDYKQETRKLLENK